MTGDPEEMREGPRGDGEGWDRAELIGGTAAGVFLLVGGWMILSGEPRGAAAAVVLWTGALAMAGLGFGRSAAGPSSGTDAGTDPGGDSGTRAEPDDGTDVPVATARRRLNLSERIALGPVGGLLGGAVVAVVAAAVTGIGATQLLGVEAGAGAGDGLPGLGRRLWTGALWGILFGVFYPRVPGRSPLGRGAWFAVIPALWALLVEYPFLRGQGWAGVELGGLTFLLILLLHLLWGLTAGAVFQWAELTSEGSLDRRLGAASS